MSLTTFPPPTAPRVEPLELEALPLPAFMLAHTYLLTVGQYDQMVETGILGKRDRVELIEGMLVTKMVRNRPHIVSGKKALRTLERIVRPGWHVAKEDPAVVSDRSKPEPDLTVIRGQAEDYLERDVSADDIALAVEISDSSLSKDRVVIKPIYAASGIPVYWIINLVARRLEVYSDPRGNDYGSAEFLTPEQEVPVIIGGVEVGRVRVADLLP